MLHALDRRVCADAAGRVAETDVRSPSFGEKIDLPSRSACELAVGGQRVFLGTAGSPSAERSTPRDALVEELPVGLEGDLVVAEGNDLRNAARALVAPRRADLTIATPDGPGARARPG